MKKEYNKPEIKVIDLKSSDFQMNHSSEHRPGHGYGDDNHEHDGPPGNDDDIPVKELWQTL